MAYSNPNDFSPGKMHRYKASADPNVARYYDYKSALLGGPDFAPDTKIQGMTPGTRQVANLMPSGNVFGGVSQPAQFRVARSAELPPVSASQVQPVSVAPQAAPARVAQSAQLPTGRSQSMMSMVADRVGRAPAQTSPGPVQQTPMVPGEGVGGQAQANRNARLQASGVDVGMARRALIDVRTKRNQADGVLRTLRAEQYRRRQMGDFVGAASLGRDIATAEGEVAQFNADLNGYYKNLNATVGDLDPATQAKNFDNLNAQLPAAQKMVTQQMEGDVAMRRQKMLANEKRMFQNERAGYTSQQDVDYDKLLGNAAKGDYQRSDAELMRRREMLARDGAQDIGAFKAASTPDLNTSAILRDQETTLADRSAATELSNAERKAAVAKATSAGDVAVAEADMARTGAEMMRRRMMLQNEREMMGNTNEQRAAALAEKQTAEGLTQQESQTQIDDLAKRIGPALKGVATQTGPLDTDQYDFAARVAEGMNELEKLPANVRKLVAEKIMSELPDELRNDSPLSPATMLLNAVNPFASAPKAILGNTVFRNAYSKLRSFAIGS
jgi:hypothetical protein